MSASRKVVKHPLVLLARTLRDSQTAYFLFVVFWLLARWRFSVRCCHMGGRVFNFNFNFNFNFTYFVGSLVFYALSDGWSFTDAFYFTSISLTTIGLGDFTPGANQLVFWYFYVALNLGLVASVIQGLSELAGLMAANARVLTEVIEESIDDVLTVDEAEFSGDRSPI